MIAAMSRSRTSVDRPGSQSALKSANQQRLLDLLLVNGELTQAEISRRSGLAPAPVSNIVRAFSNSCAAPTLSPFTSSRYCPRSEWHSASSGPGLLV